MSRAGDCRLARIPVFDRNTSIEALSYIAVGILHVWAIQIVSKGDI